MKAQVFRIIQVIFQNITSALANGYLWLTSSSAVAYSLL